MVSLSYKNATEYDVLVAIVANNLRREKMFSDAEDMLREGLEEMPNSAFLMHGLAKVMREYKNEKADREAMSLLERAYGMDSSNKFFAMDYALLLTQKKQFPKAEKVYARLYSDEGANVRLLTALGNLYQAWGKHQTAITAFDMACALPDADRKCERRYLQLTGKEPSGEVPKDWPVLAAFLEKLGGGSPPPAAGYTPESP